MNHCSLGRLRAVLLGTALFVGSCAGGLFGAAPRLVNLSYLGTVGVGEAATLASFTIEGTAAKSVLIRGVGPTLATFGVANFLADPMLTVHDATGALVAGNDDWGANAAAITAANTTVGAFQLTAGSRDAALIATLNPGTYTVRFSGVGNTSGSVLAEVYEMQDTLPTRVAYQAVRTQVASGQSATVGLSLGGVGATGNTTVLLRAVGPALGVTGALANPTMSVFSGSTNLGTNDNWGTVASNATVASAVTTAGLKPFADSSNDSALVLTLAAGSYSVQASGVGGTGGIVEIEMAVIDVDRAATFAPALIAPPQITVVALAGSATLAAPAIGKPTPSYQWSKAGSAISGATNATLTLTNVQVGDFTNYTVAITNTAGTTTSADYAVVLPAAPTITTQPTVQVVAAGGTATFTVAATGAPSPTYQWLFNGVPIAGALYPTLTIANAQVANAGSYSVRVTNSQGSVTSTAAPLTGAAAAPVISAQPQSVSVPVGQTATLAVSATGGGTLAYQWRRNGFALAGATASTYARTSVELADADVYDVVVSDGLSATVSAAARIGVSPTVYPAAVKLDPAFNLSVESDSNGSITTVAPYSSTQFLAGGNFIRVSGNNTIRRLARFNNDGTLDSTFAANIGGFNVDCALALPDGKVLAAGAFGSVNGVIRTNLVRLNSDGSLDTSFNVGGSGPNNRVLTIVRQTDGRLLIGGYFTAYNGTGRAYVARLNADGTLDTTFNASISTSTSTRVVAAIAVQTDGKVVLGGIFSTVGGITVANLARVSSTGAYDSTFAIGTGAGSTVNALGLDAAGNVIVGGAFTTFNGVSNINRLVRLTPLGAIDTSFNATGGGGYTTAPTVALSAPPAGGTTATATATINANGQVTGFTITAAGSGYTTAPTVTLSGGGGSGATATATITGGAVTAIALPASNAGLNNTVNTLAYDSAANRWLVGGSFTSYNGATINRLARLNAFGVRDTTFSPNVSSTVLSVYQQSTDGAVVFGGQFTTVATLSTRFVSRVTSAGARDAAVNLAFRFPGSVFRLLPLPAGKMLIAGSFTHLGNTPSVNLARLNADFTPDITFTPGGGSGYTTAPTVTITGGGGTGATATALINVGTGQVAGFTITAGGSGYTTAPTVTISGGGGAGAIATATLTSGAVSALTLSSATSGPNGAVLAAELLGNGKIVIAGGFTSFNGNSAAVRVTRLNADLSRDATFVVGTGPGSQVNTLAVLPGGSLYLGGAFTSVNGVARAGVARLTPDGAVDLGFNAGATAFTVNSLAVQPSDGKVVAGGSFTTVNGVAQANLTRLNPDGAVDPTFAVAAASATIFTVALQPDAKILIGGDFTATSGVTTQNHARLNTDGTPDPAYPMSTMLNGTIYSIARQEDGKNLVYGYHSTGVGGSPGSVYLSRITSDGALDPSLSLSGMTYQTGGAPFAQQILPDGSILLGTTALAGLGREHFGLAHLVPATLPTIATVSAVEVRPGSVVAITGTNFSDVGAVRFGGLNGAAAAFTVNSPTSITATVPANAASGAVVVQTSSGTTSSPTALVVAPDFRLRNPGTTASSFDAGIAHGKGITVMVTVTGELWTSANGIAWTRSYNGANGFRGVAFAGGKFIATGNSGTLLTSDDGLAWTPRVVNSSNNITGAAHNGTRWVAVTDGGAYHVSTDAVTWTTLYNGPAVEAVGFGAGQFVAAGASGAIRTSPDGLTWTSRTSGTTATFNDVQFINGQFILVGNSGVIYDSTDGITWTLRASGTSNTLYAVAYGAGRYVIGTSGTATTVVSSDGLFWTPTGAGLGLLRSVVYTGTQFIASGAIGNILTSPDGLTWTPRQSLPHRSYRDVAYGNGRFIAVSSSGSSSYALSLDGTAWSDGTGAAGTSVGLNGIGYGAGQFVAVAGNTILTTTDGLTWTNRSPAGSYTLVGVAYGGGAFVAVGSAGVAYRSTDGVAWSPVTTGTTNALNSVAYGAGGFVAVGALGAVQTSADGINWVTVTPVTANNLSSVRFAGGQFVSVGSSGTVLTSPTGAAWTVRTTPAAAGTLTSLDYGDGYYLAVSSSASGSFFTSPDAITWNQVTPAGDAYNATGTPGVAFGNGRFAVVGANGFIASSNPASDQPVITTQPANAVVAAGGSSSLSVGVSGTGLTYQWYEGGSGVTTNPISGAAGATYSTPAISLRRSFWVRVTGPGGLVIDSAAAVISPNLAAPVISVLSPDTVRPGATLSIFGSGFVDVSEVRFNGVGGMLAAAFTVDSANSITTTIPLGAVSGPVYVKTAYGAVSSTATLTVAPDWRRRSPTLAADTFNGLAFGAGLTVAVGSPGAILSSPDGTTWTVRYQSGSANASLDDVVFANGLFVAVGTAGRVMTSPDGITWTERSSLVNDSFTGVAYGAGRFVAVTSTSTVATSTDGITWLANSSGAASNAVTFGNGMFIAVGAPGAVRSSTNGTVWSVIDTPVADNLVAVTYANNLFMAVGSNETFLTSVDGVTWVRQLAPTNFTGFGLNSVTFGLGRWVVGAGSAVFNSTDNGVTWTPTSFSNSFDLSALVFDGTRFIGAGLAGSLGSSTNGSTWTVRAAATPVGMNDVVYGNGRFVGVGDVGTAVTSTDGIAWTANTIVSTTTTSFTDVAFGSGLFAAVSNAGNIYTSPTGSGWAQRLGGMPFAYNAIAYGNGAFVAAGASGQVSRSVDGLVWTSTTVGADTYSTVTFGGPAGFVLAASNGTILTSPDGDTWTPRTSGVALGINGITYGGGQYVAVGNSSAVLTSPDGITWTTRNLGTTGITLTDIAYGDGLYVASRNNTAGIVFVSLDAVTWAPSTLGNHLIGVSNGVAFGNGRFVLVGSDGAILSSGTAAGANITTQPATQTIAAAGLTATMSVTAAGTGLTYQWYEGVSGNVALPVAAATSATFTTPALNQSTRYWVRVTGSDGSSVDSAMANVNGPVAIVGQPLSRSANDLSSSTFVVTALGSGTLTYQWKKDGADLAGATTSSLTVSPLSPASAGNYTVMVANTLGSVTSAAATLTVTPVAPTLTQKTTFGLGTVVQSGSVVDLQYTAVGTQPVTVQWQRDGVDIPGASGAPDAANLSHLYLLGVRPSDMADRRAVATNSVGSVTGVRVNEAQFIADEAAWTWHNPLPVGTGVPFGNVVSTSTGFVALGSRGFRATSPDGLGWAVQPTLSSNTLVAQVSGNGRQVVLGSNGYVAVSTDGISWTAANLGVMETTNELVFGQGLFVVLCSSGRVYTSPDGLVWTPRETGAGEAVFEATFGGGQFVISTATGKILRSADGITWSAPVASPLSAIWLLRFGNGQFVLGGSAGELYTSTDAVTWTAQTSGVTTLLANMAYADGRYVIVGNAGTILTSTDGVTWTPRTSGVTTNLGGVAFQNATWVAVSTNSNTVLTSSDQGVTWVARNSAATLAQLNSVASNGSNLILAVGVNGAVLRSANGVTWTAGSAALGNVLNEIIYDGGTFYAAGNNGALEATTDGINWGTLNPGTGSSLSYIGRLNGTLFVAGSSGTLRSSATNGASWNTLTSNTSQTLTGMAFGAGTYVVVGAGGTILSSTNTTTWTPRTSGTTQSIVKVAFANNVFVAVGSAGTILTSPDGTTWTSRSFGSAENFTHITYAAGQFMVSGGGSGIFTSPDGVTWSARLTGTATGNIRAVTEFNGRVYAVGGAGSILSAAIAPSIVQQPVARTGTVGQSVELSVMAAGAVLPTTYQWRKAGDPVAGATTARLTLPVAQLGDAGSYDVVVTAGAASVTSNPAILTVNAALPPVITSVTTASGTVGQTFVYAITASNVPVSFTAGGLPAGLLINTSTGVITGTPSVAGTFTVTLGATNSGGTGNASLSLTISPAPVAPAIVTQPADRTVLSGQTATFTVVASGTAPLSYQWYQGTSPNVSNPVSGATAASFTTPAVTATTSYWVRVSNAVSSVDSATATVSLPSFVPTVALTSESGAEYLPAGGTATLRARVTYTGQTPTALGIVVSLPAGWTFASYAGPGAAASPTAGDSFLEWAFSTIPAGELTYTFTVNYPAGQTGDKVTSGSVNYRPGNLDVPFAALTLRPMSKPTITTHPTGKVVAVDTGTTLTVVATGTGTLTYQWKKDGANVVASTRVTGSTTATLSLAGLTLADGGTYTVDVSNAAGTVTSNAAGLTVVDARPTHAVVGSGYFAGSTVTLTSTMTYSGPCSALGWNMLLPTGWTYASGGGSEGDVKPPVGTASLLEWAWTSVPASPVTFTTTLNVPSTDSGDKAVAATAIFRSPAGAVTILVKPDPLVVTQLTNHDADSDRNFRISLLELTRVIELYNTRNGSSRTGCYKVDAAGEDGFNPEPTRTSSAVVTLTRYHSADSDRNGKISLLELTRVIELYNYRVGSSRTGDYHVHPGSEDGYNPGPLSTHPTQ